ncbi:MAG: hypothetical protein WBO31_06085, partial [Saprospiraceae bacterium]
LLKDPISIPKLGNLDKIKQKIEADEKQRVERLIEFNEENVAKFWEQCKEEEKSNSLKVILQNVILKNDKNTITLAVGNVISREAIRAELKLDEKIRQTFKEKNIKYQIEIDPALAALEEKKSIKILSAKEKWDLMISTNTKLEDFKNKLQLKVDED